MHRVFSGAAGASLLAMMLPTPTVAKPATLFDRAAVSDAELGASAGMGAPFQRLSWRQLGIAADFQARNDFRALGAVGRIEMDVWWGTTGSELIAQSVRSSL